MPLFRFFWACNKFVKGNWDGNELSSWHELEVRVWQPLQTSPTWPRNTFCRVLIWINRFKITTNTWQWGRVFMKLLQKSFYLVVLSSTHIWAQIPLNASVCLLNPLLWKYMLLCGLCVDKRIVLKRGREGRRNLASTPIFQLSSIEWSTKANENWFSSYEIFSKSKQKIFRPIFSPEKSWCVHERLRGEFSSRLIDLIHTHRREAVKGEKTFGCLLKFWNVCFIIESIFRWKWSSLFWTSVLKLFGMTTERRKCGGVHYSWSKLIRLNLCLLRSYVATWRIVLF